MSVHNVLVIDEFDNGISVEQHLRQQGYQVATLKRRSLDLLQVVSNLRPDVVVLNLYRPDEEILHMILALNERCSVPVIMFAEDQQTDTINKVIKAGVSAYIVDGLEPRRIKTIIEVAIARFNEQQALKNELQRTKTQLEERKFIDRAKGILSQSQGYSEEQAYQALRKLAMDRKVSMGEMAKNVIAMAELLK